MRNFKFIHTAMFTALFSPLRYRIFILLFPWLFGLNFSGVEAQNPVENDSVVIRNISLGDLMDSLNLRFSLDFAYDAGIVNTDSIVNAEIELPITEEWLDRYFGGEGVEVKLIDKQVIIARLRGQIPPEQAVRIKGRVEEFVSGQPLAMATIGVTGKPVGTVTNDAGSFEFLLSRNYIGEKLVFSYLGHLGKEMVIPGVDTFLVVRLPATSIELPEVNVLYEDANDIIRETSSRINDNYPHHPSFLTAFFRETIQQDEKYVEVSEAIVEILKPSYGHAFDQERVRFIRGRRGRETADMDLINFKLVGGPYHFSRLDVVRNGDFFPEDEGQGAYRYSFNGIDIEFDRIVYRVGFSPRRDTEGLYYQGEMRIDTESYALVSIEFELTPASVQRSRSYLIQRDARRFQTQPVFARYKVDYRPWNNRWVLSRVRGTVNLRILDRSRQERSVFHTVSEMLVSDFTEASSRDRIRWAETFRPSYVLSEHLGEFDPDFWRDYNIIQPDDALEKVFDSLP